MPPHESVILFLIPYSTLRVQVLRFHRRIFNEIFGGVKIYHLSGSCLIRHFNLLVNLLVMFLCFLLLSFLNLSNHILTLRVGFSKSLGERLLLRPLILPVRLRRVLSPWLHHEKVVSQLLGDQCYLV